MTGPGRKQLHDSVHVLTGYGSDPIGEVEVQAFLLGSKFRVTHIILGLGLLRLIHKQRKTSADSPSVYLLWERLGRAYQRGQKSQFDFDAWQPELRWELPITQVQAELHIEQLC